MKSAWIAALVFLSLVLNAQKIRLTGSVRSDGGEAIPMAPVFVLPDSVVITSDENGAFSAQVARGKKSFIVSYAGFETMHISLKLSGDSTIHFRLRERVTELKEVVVESDRFSYEDVLNSTRLGTNTITQKDIESIPVFLGEADPIKAVQLLPGVVRGVEGTSDVFVRGGAADQNLVLLDGAPVYNTGHLFGFLSVFNPDIVDQVEVITGGFPSQYGGRLSSVLDVSTHSDITDKTHVSADIGLIGARMKLEQPVVKDKASFWIAGRRSYIDQVVKKFSQSIPYYFYDLNGKFIYRPSRHDNIEFSQFHGSDKMNLITHNDSGRIGMLTSFSAANSTQTLHWKHDGPGRWTNEFAVFSTGYKYKMKNTYEEYSLSGASNVSDHGARISVHSDSVFRGHVVEGGLEWIHHAMQPNIVNASGRMTDAAESGGETDIKMVNEIAGYAQTEWAVRKNLRANAGLRNSFAFTGQRTYFFPEPRLSARYALTKNQALKFNYSRMAQYIHRISNSAVSTPIDIWSPVTERLKPQRSHQFSLAWQRFVPATKVYLSVESYYKAMRGLVNYREGTNLLFNADYAKSLIQGKGRAYGFEFLGRKDAGKFSGWISYSLSWSMRQFGEINEGKWFHARYDRRHNGAIVSQYKIGSRSAVSMVWEFISGARFTPMTGQYVTSATTMSGVEVVPLYAVVNSAKLADSHRLDLGIKFFNKPGSKFEWTWFAGVYNVYNRTTPVAVVATRDSKTGLVEYNQRGLFGLLPFISYECKI